MAFQLIYVSAAKSPFTPKELEELLELSRKNNTREGLTGMLLYEGGSFLQLLEGDEEAVNRTFARIAADQRHHRVMVISRGHRRERMFPDWSMGFPHLSKAGSARPEGYNDFFSGRSGDAGTAIPNTSMAAQILEAFRSGRWHVYVSDSTSSDH